MTLERLQALISELAPDLGLTVLEFEFLNDCNIQFRAGEVETDDISIFTLTLDLKGLAKNQNGFETVSHMDRA